MRGNSYKSMGVLDVWLLLYIFSIQVYITKLTYRVYTVQLKGNSNLLSFLLIALYIYIYIYIYIYGHVGIIFIMLALSHEMSTLFCFILGNSVCVFSFD